MSTNNAVRKDRARATWSRVIICREVVSKIKKDVADLDYQIKDLEGRLETSEDQLWTLKHQREARKFRLRLANSDVATALAEYDRLCMREFCDKVMAKLPRELLDGMYEFALHTGPIDICVLDDKQCQGGTFPLLGIEYKMVDSTDMSPNLRYQFDIDNIGVIMRKEMAEVWYRTTSFNFAPRDHLLSKFLEHDHWGINVDPRKFLARVQLSFHIMDVIKDGNHSFVVSSALHELHKLRPGAHVTIGIFATSLHLGTRGRSSDPIFPRSSRSLVLLPFLEAARSKLRDLEQQEIRFEVVLARAEDGGLMGRFLSNKFRISQQTLLDTSTEELAKLTDCWW